MPAAPLFFRMVYNADMKREKKAISACDCNQPTRKTKAHETTCGNCGGAVLTEREREFLKSLHRPPQRFIA